MACCSQVKLVRSPGDPVTPNNSRFTRPGLVVKPFATRQPYILYERVLYKSRDEGYIPLQYARLRCVLIPHKTAAQGGQQRELPQITYILFAVCVHYSQYVQAVIACTRVSF